MRAGVVVATLSVPLLLSSLPPCGGGLGGGCARSRARPSGPHPSLHLSPTRGERVPQRPARGGERPWGGALMPRPSSASAFHPHRHGGRIRGPRPSLHHQRPARSGSPGRTARVQGWQPIERKPWAWSAFTGTRSAAQKAATSVARPVVQGIDLDERAAPTSQPASATPSRLAPTGRRAARSPRRSAPASARSSGSTLRAEAAIGARGLWRNRSR
jgi:hypothetical protein